MDMCITDYYPILGTFLDQISVKLKSGGALFDHLTARSPVKCTFSTLFSTEAQNVKRRSQFWEHFWNQISLKLDSGAAQFCNHIFEGVKKVNRIEI